MSDDIFCSVIIAFRLKAVPLLQPGDVTTLNITQLQVSNNKKECYVGQYFRGEFNLMLYHQR